MYTDHLFHAGVWFLHWNLQQIRKTGSLLLFFCWKSCSPTEEVEGHTFPRAAPDFLRIPKDWDFLQVVVRTGGSLSLFLPPPTIPALSELDRETSNPLKEGDLLSPPPTPMRKVDLLDESPTSQSSFRYLVTSWMWHRFAGFGSNMRFRRRVKRGEKTWKARGVFIQRRFNQSQ